MHQIGYGPGYNDQNQHTNIIFSNNFIVIYEIVCFILCNMKNKIIPNKIPSIFLSIIDICYTIIMK